jgi:hypothetical protein
MVGEKRLVDHCHHSAQCGVTRGLLVHRTWRGVEVHGCKYLSLSVSWKTSQLTRLQLFIGVMSSLYSVWDICDDLILRKVNSSDASVFAKRYGGSSQCWGVIWSLVSLVFMVCGILAGLAAFKQSFEQQEKDSQDFIPTVRMMMRV